ncbi:MAG TPA: hypothetical protein DD670_20905 [Planctomycetaceae bacterium]|nr:hypothetical protein [Planctomycetaceae bacterium]
MNPTDTSEKGLEALIVEWLARDAGYVLYRDDDRVQPLVAQIGWSHNLIILQREFHDREHALDLARLRAFVEEDAA